MIVELNINDIVGVKLTPDGEDVLQGRKGSTSDGHRLLLGSMAGLLADGSLRLPLWRLMSVFGPFMYTGAPMLFVKNRVTLTSL